MFHLKSKVLSLSRVSKLHDDVFYQWENILVFRKTTTGAKHKPTFHEFPEHEFFRAMNIWSAFLQRLFLVGDEGKGKGKKMKNEEKNKESLKKSLFALFSREKNYILEWRNWEEIPGNKLSATSSCSCRNNGRKFSSLKLCQAWGSNCSPGNCKASIRKQRQ